VHVVLSANVFVACVRAVALAVAASRSVRVRPSSREAVMAPLLCRAAADATGVALFAVCERIESSPGDVIHVYGRLETIDAVKRESRPGVHVVGHGPGFGVALVDARSDPLALAAVRLSWDVIAFDQRGCLSPRIALVHGSVSDAEAFADGLARELEERERQVPRGTLTDDERRDQALYRRTASAVGRCHAGATFTVGVDPVPRALTLPPSGRHVHVARVGETIDVARLLAPFQNAITCIGGYDSETSLAHSLFTTLRGVRLLPLGRMQSPPLDGPVDLRGML
jgi:Acyl-CoA reductase (LuxC)